MQKIANKAAEMARPAAAPAEKPEKHITDLIKRMEGEIKKALPSVITPERFTRIVLSALRTNPKLGLCTPMSFMASMMTAAQLGLEVNTPTGLAYLVPFFNGKDKVLECQFQIGYKGLIELARRSGEVATIMAHEVRENDEFDYELGLHPDLKHKPAKENRGKVISYYAAFTLVNGGFGFEVMSLDDVKQHRDDYSKAAGKGFSPWDSNFDEMAKKTVLKKCLKYAPLKSEFVRAASADETIKHDISDDMFALPDETITAEFADEADKAEQSEKSQAPSDK